MQTKYTKKFKIEAVRRALSRGEGISLLAVARSLDVKNTTLHGWIKAMKDKQLIDIPTSGESIEKSPYQWTVNERFEAIVETSKLSDEECNEYCRKKGIFPHHIETWKTECLESYGGEKAGSLKELKELKNENKALASELRRKEKALAEAAALLILKKKAHILWRSEEED